MSPGECVEVLEVILQQKRAAIDVIARDAAQRELPAHLKQAAADLEEQVSALLMAIAALSEPEAP